MRTSTAVLATFATLNLAPLAAQPAQRAAPPPCSAEAGYVCGQQGPEDLVALGADWAVASVYGGSGFRLIRISDRTSHNAFPSDSAIVRHDAEKFPDCPEPPGTSGRFQTHGVYVAPGGGPVHELLVVGHIERESIEYFEVDASGEMPVITWRGCVIAPEPIGLNSVRGLADGGFITTNFLPRNQSTGQMMSGDPNGEIWEWHADTGWQEVPGSEASGANGVELSDDGQTIYVAAWGSQSFFRLSRGESPPVREDIDLGFRIDNIHWARDGRLLAAGQAGQDWQVVKIDPDTLAVEEIYRQADDAAFFGGTVALEVGDDLWIGSFSADRIAIVPAP